MLIVGSMKSRMDHPCCRAGKGASSHIYHAALYSHLKHLTPLWLPSLFQSKGLSKQHRKGPSGIRSAVIHIWHFHKGSELLDFFLGYCRTFHSSIGLSEKPINISRPVREQEAALSPLSYKDLSTSYFMCVLCFSFKEEGVHAHHFPNFFSVCVWYISTYEWRGA